MPASFARVSSSNTRGFVTSGILAGSQTIYTSGSSTATAGDNNTLNSNGTIAAATTAPPPITDTDGDGFTDAEEAANGMNPNVPDHPHQVPNPALWPAAWQQNSLLFTGNGAAGQPKTSDPKTVTIPANSGSWLVVLATQSEEFPVYTRATSQYNDTVKYEVTGDFSATDTLNVNDRHSSMLAGGAGFQGLKPVDVQVLGTVTADPSKDKKLTFKLTITNVADGILPTTAILSLLPVEVRQHPISATSGTGDPPASSGPIRFCRWIDAYPLGIREVGFENKDRDRFQIRIPAVVPNLTKMRIKATELNGAVINGVVTSKTTDGDYEVDMKQENGAMVSESILLVSDGDDDVTFNGKGTDNGKNDQTLLADFGSKVIVTFPELGSGETTFQVQQPIATVTLDMVYCYPKATGAAPITAIPAEMLRLMNLQARKMQEIYRQIGIKVDGVAINRLLPFSADWITANGSSDPANYLTGDETDGLMVLVKQASAASNKIRVGFVEAGLTESSDDTVISGKADGVGKDPCLVSIAGPNDDDRYNILAHEAGHSLGNRHFTLYAPNINHWLMRAGAGSQWRNDSTAAKRWDRDDADFMKQTATPFYVPSP